MQREIKFRAWDSENINMWELKTLFLDMKYRPSLTIMQYTGLKDKNGKEIYEGDIIQPTRGLDERKGYVKFLNGCFVLQFKDEYYSLNWYEGERGEVIGNIHENPELLNL